MTACGSHKMYDVYVEVLLSRFELFVKSCRRGSAEVLAAHGKG